MRAQLLLFSLKIEIGREECSKLWKMIVFSIFSRLGPFPQVFGHVQEWLMLILNKIIRAWHVVAYPIFYFVLWAKLVGKSVESYEKWWFFSVFNRLDHFAQVFRQVKECLILQLHEMIRVLHEVACPIVFILFYDPYWQEGVFKLMKNYHIFSIFSRFCPFPQVFGKVNDWSILAVHEMIRVLHMVACSNAFILLYGRDWQGGVFKFMKNGIFFCIFTRFGLFPQYFGQLMEWSILELHEMIRVLRVVACPVGFVWFYDRDWEGGVLKMPFGSFPPSFLAG